MLTIFFVTLQPEMWRATEENTWLLACSCAWGSLMYVSCEVQCSQRSAVKTCIQLNFKYIKHYGKESSFNDSRWLGLWRPSEG